MTLEKKRKLMQYVIIINYLITEIVEIFSD